MSSIKLFETHQVRSLWDSEKEAWFFSIVDVVGVLTDSVDAGAYWRKLKQRLKTEGNETVTNCHGLKMTAPDGKMRLTALRSQAVTSSTGRGARDSRDLFGQD